MSILFADIYDGIRAIRISKGVCEKDILNYVEEKAGGCMKVGNVLKTIRTLQKLVDDGQLVKNGNRYSFPPKDCENEEDQEEEGDEEEEENEEELDMDPDECDQCDEDEGEEEGQQEEEQEDQNKEEEEDEDEEEEDEDDDDDEEEDDEEDDSCNEIEGSKNSGSRCSNNNDENGKGPDTSPSSQGEPDCSGAQKPPVDMSYSRNRICRGIESNNKGGRKLPKEKHILEEKNGANINAFCARDFIDSLAESKTDKNCEEKIETSKAAERVFRVSKRFSTSGKKYQPVPTRDNMARFRSRSPLRGRKRDFSLIGQDVSQNFSFTGAEKDALGGTIDNKMELDVEIDAKDISVPEKNPPKESSSLHDVNMEFQDDKDRVNVIIEPGILNKSGSSSLVENIPRKETLKLMELKSASQSNMIWYTLEDSDNVPDVLQASPSFESGNVIDKKYSTCSVCEKKKRIS